MKYGNKYKRNKNKKYSDHDILLYFDGTVVTGILLFATIFQAKVLVGNKVITTSISKLYSNKQNFRFYPKGLEH